MVEVLVSTQAYDPPTPADAFLISTAWPDPTSTASCQINVWVVGVILENVK